MDEVAWKIARSVYPVLVSVAAIGLCLNTLLLVTTIRTRTLRSTANILIGCCALFDIMHEFGYFIQFPILFSDYYIDSFYCSLMQFVPALGRAAGAFCVLCIGIDRMLVLVVSLVYKRMKKGYFLLCHLLSIALFCGWTVFLMVAYWTPKQQICSMPAPFHGDSLGLWSNSITVVNIISAILYLITWQALKRQAGESRTEDYGLRYRSIAVSSHNRRVFKSIAIVMIVEVTGWFISSILIDLSKVYVVPERRPPFHYVACLFVNSGIAAKAIVYYSICADYRRAIRALFGLSPLSNVVSSSTSNARPQTGTAVRDSSGAGKYVDTEMTEQGSHA